MEYSEWLNTWIKNYVAPARKIRTRELYESIVNRRIKPYLGGYLLEELTPLVMQKFITRTLLSGKKNRRRAFFKFRKRHNFRDAKFSESGELRGTDKRIHGE